VINAQYSRYTTMQRDSAYGTLYHTIPREPSPVAVAAINDMCAGGAHLGDAVRCAETLTLL
jgi:hypothetical protein